MRIALVEIKVFCEIFRIFLMIHLRLRNNYCEGNQCKKLNCGLCLERFNSTNKIAELLELTYTLLMQCVKGNNYTNCFKYCFL